MMLITPEKFLKRTASDSPRALAIRIYKKLQVELDSHAETSINYLEAFVPNFFTLAFTSELTATRVFQQVQKRVEKAIQHIQGQEEPEFRFLPPLFLLSNDKFIVMYDDILLIGCEDGPIIPVVPLKTMREKNILEQLIFIYSLSSEDYVNIDSIRSKLIPNQDEEATMI